MLKSIGRYRLGPELSSDSLTVTHDARLGSAADAARVRVRIGKLPVRLPPEDLLLFKSEVEATQELSDAHLDPVIDHGVQHGMAYIVHPFVQATPLSKRLAADARVAPSLVALMGLDVAWALTAAHACEPPLIHRAISLDTLWVDDEAAVRVIGYALSGVSTRAADAVPAMRTISGRFRAPEQVARKSLGPECDLFSLGAVLRALLTGEVPAAGAADLSGFRPTVPDMPPRFEAALTRVLSADPAARGTARELVDDLSACVPDPSVARRRLAARLGIDLADEPVPAPSVAFDGAPPMGVPLDSVTKEQPLPPLPDEPTRHERAAGSFSAPPPLVQGSDVEGPPDTVEMSADDTALTLMPEYLDLEREDEPHDHSNPGAIERTQELFPDGGGTDLPVERTVVLHMPDVLPNAGLPNAGLPNAGLPNAGLPHARLADTATAGPRRSGPPHAAPAPARRSTMPLEAPVIHAPEVGSSEQTWIERQSKVLVLGWPLPWLLGVAAAALGTVVVVAVLTALIAG